ncbi:MAG TPA: DNA gyrase subunit B [Devosia sp.]|jgi:ElaB/YqjD/DUF883 family membrane-anchored ribosome-binding protein|uniref:DUF883 family protein n=1 Tax=Devosia sp. TaxID=1871048 RepID=UPI002F930887
MAQTSDLAPDNEATTAAAARVNRASAKAREAQLEEQVAQLQNDLKGIAATLAKLTSDRVNEAKAVAKNEAHNLQRHAENAVDEVQLRAMDMEEQLKASIREKPLTAVASALGIGYLLALLTRH